MTHQAPWQNPRILFTLFAIFLSGAAAGAITMRMSVSPERHKAGLYWTQEGRDISLQRFSKELNLTPDQERELSSVLDDFMTYYQTLQAQMDDVRSQGKQRILKILHDDQKQRFEKMLDEITAKQIR